jgi:L-ribulose-5-phosphate 3-epimerase
MRNGVGMILGYNTNGFAHHRLADAIEIVHALGYTGLAITPDFAHSLHDADNCRTLRAFGNRLHYVLESGARFVLDPWRKHSPTLISEGAAHRQREDYLRELIDLSEDLGIPCLSFWSGTASDDSSRSVLMARLVDGCKRLADYAADRKVRLAFEPEPGMFVETMDQFAELHAQVNHPNFGLTVDVGHLVCTGELPISRHLVTWKDWLWNIHIADMKPGVHDHLMFGEGSVDFADVFEGLRAAGYAGMVSVELSRHSYDAVNAARKSFEFLQRFVTGPTS